MGVSSEPPCAMLGARDRDGPQADRLHFWERIVKGERIAILGGDGLALGG